MKKALLIGFSMLLVFLFCACGGNLRQADVDLKKFYDKLKTQFDIPDQEAVKKEDIEALFPGMEKIKLKQSVLMVAKDRDFSNEILMVEAENEEDSAKIAEIFEAHRDSLQDKWSTGFADQLKLVNDAVFKANGKYAILAIDPSSDRIGEEFDKLFKK
ncbi:MAG: hypothetical protein BWY11_00739 [Firmicutes bacterium ADurb.Bin182]|nr:MAG: hypothetical protein BWY11_00739 [Firmicutes bacterium ADurb.Bin182]